MPEPKPWLTVVEAAFIVGRDKRNIWRWIEKGHLRAREAEDGTMRVSYNDLLTAESRIRRGRPTGGANRK